MGASSSWNKVDKPTRKVESGDKPIGKVGNMAYWWEGNGKASVKWLTKRMGCVMKISLERWQSHLISASCKFTCLPETFKNEGIAGVKLRLRQAAAIKWNRGGAGEWSKGGMKNEQVPHLVLRHGLQAIYQWWHWHQTRWPWWVSGLENQQNKNDSFATSNGIDSVPVTMAGSGAPFVGLCSMPVEWQRANLWLFSRWCRRGEEGRPNPADSLCGSFLWRNY